jgi:phage tail protein X
MSRSANPSNLAKVYAYQGETLDGLIHRTAGLGPESLPAVLKVNPGIAKTMVLPARQVVFLPPQPLVPPVRPITQLWT